MHLEVKVKLIIFFVIDPDFEFSKLCKFFSGLLQSIFYDLQCDLHKSIGVLVEQAVGSWEIVLSDIICTSLKNKTEDNNCQSSLPGIL